MLVGRADTFSLSIEEEDSAGVMKLKILRPFAAVSPPRPSQTNCALILVCGTNNTRWRTNMQARRALGFPRLSRVPTAGEKVVCLKNDYGVDAPVFNGETWRIERVCPANILGTPAYDLVLISNLYSARTKVTVPRSFFETGDPPFELKVPSLFQEFSWGYAITAHKAQGSEWPSVAVIDESDVFREMGRRWLYTAVTRASDRLVIVGGAS